MKALVGVAIAVKNDPDTQYVVDQKHWEMLKNALDDGLTGWIELNSAIPGGKLMLMIENISEIFLSSEEYVENFEDRRNRSNLE